jgi:hypothetical protein
MSGGHFDYYQYHINDIADKLERNLADIEYAKSIGTVKKKNVYGHLLDMRSGGKYWPNWLLDTCNRYNNKEDVIESLKLKFMCNFNEDDGKLYFDDGNTVYEVVIYDGEREEWSDGKWHLEIDDPEIIEEFKKGLKILKMASIYAQRIDWLLSGDDSEDSFKRRLKENIDELESKPLVDYDYWKQVFEEKFDD